MPICHFFNQIICLTLSTFLSVFDVDGRLDYSSFSICKQVFGVTATSSTNSIISYALAHLWSLKSNVMLMTDVCWWYATLHWLYQNRCGGDNNTDVELVESAKKIGNTLNWVKLFNLFTLGWRRCTLIVQTLTFEQRQCCAKILI